MRVFAQPIHDPRFMMALALMGCGAGVVVSDPQAARTIHLALSADSKGMLRLTGSPVDPQYAGIYENPRALSDMAVDVFASGQFVVTCRDGQGAARCSDPPFFWQMQHANGTVRIKLWDQHGVLLVDSRLAEVPMSEDPASRNRPPGGVAQEQRNGPVAPTTPGPTGPSCLDTAALKSHFCEAVNARLEATNIDYVYDCARLSDDFSMAPVRTELPAQILNEEIGCNEITEIPASLAERQIDAASQCDEATRRDLELMVSNWRNVIRLQFLNGGVCTGSPLILDLDGDGIHLSSLEQGVEFDLLGGGSPVRCSWPAAGDALLVLDRNGNGVVDGAAELFGNATDERAFRDGFQALAELDENQDGVIDRRDRDFAALRLWRDENRDGMSARGELLSLERAGIAALEIRARTASGSRAHDEHGNGIPLLAEFTRTDGRKGLLVDAYLRFMPSKAAQDQMLTQQVLQRLLGPLAQP